MREAMRKTSAKELMEGGEVKGVNEPEIEVGEVKEMREAKTAKEAEEAKNANEPKDEMAMQWSSGV